VTDLERVTAALTDKYVIERELGQGGMATVYLARDLKHNRQVAIKVMRPEVAAAVGGEEFLREIAIAGRLQHPNILMVLDSGEADGRLYYVMPFVQGETLKSRLARETQLPIDDALQISREVASALGYAHSQEVIHHDITPDNIMLSGGHAVVMDFGIGRALSQTLGKEPTTGASTFGTPAYMSPEQAGNKLPLDGRSDVYSLACALYHMLTGEPPYTGATPEAITAKRLSDPVPSTRVVRETIPRPVDAAIQQALANDPTDRYATAEEFAAALAPGPPAADSERQGRKVGSLTTVLVTVAVVALVSLAVIMGIRSMGPGDVTSQRITLAVLPFENLGAADDEYFAEGTGQRGPRRHPGSE
jgi:serine/threonine-protein kinase